MSEIAASLPGLHEQVSDRVKLIGKISSLAKRCDQGGFTPKLTIMQVVLHSPAGSPG
ncbi:MAG: hypothetical protein ABSH36_03475 [Solirubrobacteraceae bacterium]